MKNKLCRSGRETTSARELWEDFMMRYKVKRSGCSFEMRYKRRKLWGRENTVGRGTEKQISRVATKSSLPGNGACIEANSGVASEGQAVQVRLGWPDAGLPWYQQVAKNLIELCSGRAQGHRDREEGAREGPFGRLPRNSSIERIWELEMWWDHGIGKRGQISSG